MNPPQPPSLELPEAPHDLRATRKGNSVILQWTLPTNTTDRQTLRSLGATQICRSVDPTMKECGTPVGEAPPTSAFTSSSKSKTSSRRRTKSSGKKIAGTYVDDLPSQLQGSNLFGSATYAVEVLNANGRGAGISNLVQVPLTPTLAPPPDFSGHVQNQGVVLTWSVSEQVRRPDARISYVYRVYRRAENAQTSTLVGEVAASQPGNLSLLDSNIEWEQSYYYRANSTTIVTEESKPEIRIEGQDTPELKIFTHDTFPPAVPTGLQGVFSGPGQQAFVDLVWAPVTDADLAGYNVYRHEPGGAPIRLNAELVRAPAYRDNDVIEGKEYVYSVSAVDVRGNESARSEEASEKVP